MGTYLNEKLSHFTYRDKHFIHSTHYYWRSDGDPKNTNQLLRETNNTLMINPMY